MGGMSFQALTRWDGLMIVSAVAAQAASSIATKAPTWLDYLLQGGALVLVGMFLYRLLWHEMPAWRQDSEQWRSEIKELRAEQAAERELHREAIHDITGAFRDSVHSMHRGRDEAVREILEEIRATGEGAP